MKENPEFKGKGGDFFVLYLKNILLTIVTFGIYKFWAKVETIKYLYQNTSVYNESFDYHGTGKEAFVGFVKGIFIIGGLGAVWSLINYALTAILGESGSIISVLLLYIGFISAQPLLILGSMRYHYSRTSWSQIRFGFKGNTKEFYFLFIKGAILTGLTFGIYAPWFFTNLSKFYSKSTHMGQRNFKFNGQGGDYFGIFVGGYLLTLFTFGIYSFWWKASMERYYWNNLEFGPIRFKSTISGGQVFLNDITVLAMIIFSLGLAFSWALIKTIKLSFDNLSLEGDPKLEEIVGSLDRDASSISDGVGEAAEALEQVGEMFA
ncbi:MAG: DUF898 domain-containing protein [Planctomycetes bacterium]|nr:DUF898 domain-containing protein [Planctomycetota bacterium]